MLLDFILSGSLIKKVVMPPGAVTLDDVDLDQVSVDYVLNCAKKSELNSVRCLAYQLSSFSFLPLPLIELLQYGLKWIDFSHLYL